MKIEGRSRRILAAVGIPLLAPITLAACGTDAANATAEEGDAADAYVKIVNVEVREIVSRDFTAYVRITGEAEAKEDVTVSAQEGGVILRFFSQKGKRLGRGAPIAKIDDEILAAQVDEARASAALARERYLRQKQLWEEERIGSEITFLQTRYQADEAAARLKQLEARLSRTTIRAPVAGVLDDRFVETGEIVSPGTPVARVIDTSGLEITGGVPERFGPTIEVGGQAVINFDVLAGRDFEGTIGYVGAAVDARSRTFPIEIVMDNPDGAVKPQMIANVRVATERLTDVVVVPQELVLRTELGYQVYVVGDAEGEPVAEARAVVLGPAFENEVVIESGLAPGELVVTKGHQLVDPGDRLALVGGGEAR